MATSRRTLDPAASPRPPVARRRRAEPAVGPAPAAAAPAPAAESSAAADSAPAGAGRARHQARDSAAAPAVAASAKVAKPAKAPKPAKPGKESKPPKLKQRPVRDGFTMPESDFGLIATLKARALAGQRETKKSELLRAGLHALDALDTAGLIAALNRLEPIKVGRPKKAG